MRTTTAEPQQRNRSSRTTAEPQQRNNSGTTAAEQQQNNYNRSTTAKQQDSHSKTTTTVTVPGKTQQQHHLMNIRINHILTKTVRSMLSSVQNELRHFHQQGRSGSTSIGRRAASSRQSRALSYGGMIQSRSQSAGPIKRAKHGMISESNEPQTVEGENGETQSVTDTINAASNPFSDKNIKEANTESQTDVQLNTNIIKDESEVVVGTRSPQVETFDGEQSARISTVTFQDRDQMIHKNMKRTNKEVIDKTENRSISSSRRPMIARPNTSLAQSEKSTISAFIDNSRPSTAPQLLYDTYGRSDLSSKSITPMLRQSSSTRPQSTRLINFHFDKNMSKIHKRNCYIPTEHSLDVQNAFSPIQGPNTHIKSLLGPPPAPRRLLGVVHKSAFYYAPGRYPTPSKPYPPRRSQSRTGSSRSYKNSSAYHSYNSLAWDRNY